MRNNYTAPPMGHDGNVIAMSSHRPAPRFPHVAQVEAYWDALRGARLLPDRSEVDPRGIERALEYAFILEQVAPGVARLRIAGGHLSDLLGMEVRGMPLSAFFVPEARIDLAAILEQVRTTPSTATLTLQAETGIGKPALEARLVLLPMTDAFDRITRILGCLDSQGGLGRAPRRFKITGKHLKPLIARETARQWPGSAQQPADRSAEHGLAEAPTRFGPAPLRRATYLRLIQTDR